MTDNNIDGIRPSNQVPNTSKKTGTENAKQKQNPIQKPIDLSFHRQITASAYTKFRNLLNSFDEKYPEAIRNKLDSIKKRQDSPWIGTVNPSLFKVTANKPILGESNMEGLKYNLGSQYYGNSPHPIGYLDRLRFGAGMKSIKENLQDIYSLAFLLNQDKSPYPKLRAAVTELFDSGKSLAMQTLSRL